MPKVFQGFALHLYVVCNDGRVRSSNHRSAPHRRDEDRVAVSKAENKAGRKSPLITFPRRES
jgi:hypothetical protein